MGVRTGLFVGGAVALLTYGVLNAAYQPESKPPAKEAVDEVSVDVRATFYGHRVFGQGRGGAPFITTALGVVVETEFPTGVDYRRVYRKVKRGTVVTVTVSPGENATSNVRQGCSIHVNGVLRAGPPVNDEGKAVVSPEFQVGTHAAVCTAVAS